MALPTKRILIPISGKALPIQTQDPSDVQDYTLDYRPLLQSDTIDTKTVTGTNVTIDSSSLSGNILTIWVSVDGDFGRKGKVVTKITTTGGRTLEKTFKINVEQQ